MDSESFKNLSNLMIMKNALSNPQQNQQSNLPCVLIVVFVLYIIWKQQQDMIKEMRHSSEPVGNYFNGMRNFPPISNIRNERFPQLIRNERFPQLIRNERFPQLIRGINS
jgi:hypothetical protein